MIEKLCPCCKKGFKMYKQSYCKDCLMEKQKNAKAKYEQKRNEKRKEDRLNKKIEQINNTPIKHLLNRFTPEYLQKEQRIKDARKIAANNRKKQHPEKFEEKRKAYYEANKEYFKNYNKRWRATNREKVLEQYLRRNKKRKDEGAKENNSGE